MEEKSYNSPPESKHQEQDTNQDDTATGPHSESPPSKLSGQENTSSTQDSTSPSSGKFSSASSVSSKHKTSIQMPGSTAGSSHISASDPLLSMPSDQYQLSGGKGEEICSSEAQTAGGNVVPEKSNQNEKTQITAVWERSNQNASATGSNTETNTDPEQQMNDPCRCLLSNQVSYFSKCLPLHKAALAGDVDEAKHLLGDDYPSMLREAVTKADETVFHVATGAKQTKFVKEMVNLLKDDVAPLELKNQKGNTAFCYAAAAGTIRIAEILLQKNKKLLAIRGFCEYTPLYLAALFGQRDMALFLYGQIDKEREDILTEKDKKDIFFISIHAGLYELAWKLLDVDKNLAVARDEDEKTALHLLANTPSAFTSESSGPLKMLKNLLISVLPTGMRCATHKSNSHAMKLLNKLWKEILDQNYLNVEKFISAPENLLFEAARLGNYNFLAELIYSYPYLVYQLNKKRQSIFHIAILHRHIDTFLLIYDIGFDKQLIAGSADEEGNNLLHLAAKYLQHGRAATMVPGAALEMQRELIIFKEVESVVLPTFKEMKNGKDKTPRELFTDEHAKLLERGEKWMKQTAMSCSLVATLIASVLFEAALSAPDGKSDDSAFRVFGMASAVGLSSSSISLLMFLYILTSRYTEDDFLWSLPIKLVIGISMLLISIVAMILAFSSSFILAFKQPTGRFPMSITGIVFLSVLVFIWLQYGLCRDIMYSSFRFRFSIKRRAHLFGKKSQRKS